MYISTNKGLVISVRSSFFESQVLKLYINIHNLKYQNFIFIQTQVTISRNLMKYLEQHNTANVLAVSSSRQ